MNKAQIDTFIGSEGIKQAYRESLENETSLDIICLSANYEEVIGDFFDKEYAPKLYHESMQSREILPDTFDNHEYAAKKDRSKNQVRFIKNTPSESDIMLGERKAVLVSYNQKAPFALVVRDYELVTGLKNQFQALWKSLEK